MKGFGNCVGHISSIGMDMFVMLITLEFKDEIGLCVIGINGMYL